MSKVVLGFSGGVDSAVSAVLLQKAGHEVHGVYLDNAEESARLDAVSAAERMGIALTVIDVKRELEENVCRPFTEAYLRGETPNPCIICNPSVKFKTLIAVADRIDAELVATGHYARVEQLPDGRYTLKKAVDTTKDQSYVLAWLTQEQLAHTRFPLGGLHKTEAREIAEAHGFCNAHKHDSQDICFVPDGDYAAAVERLTGTHSEPGRFVDTQGKVLGTHRGIIHYTIGQRRGLGIAAEAPLYVCGIDVPNNEVVLGRNEALFSTELDASGCNWISGDVPGAPLRVTARIRYRQPEQPCTVTATGPDTVHVSFTTPQRAITRGQAVVFYDGDTVLGGGTID